MTRKDYLLAQKQKGRNILGVFPGQYPREILWSMNVVPAEIWDPPLEIRAANAHLQPRICSVVRLGLELILQGKCDWLDGFLFPHTCDSIQNVASVINDFLDKDKPCYFFYNPKEPYGGATRDYYMDELANLIGSLGRQFAKPDEDKLGFFVRKGQQVQDLFREFYDMRARGELGITNEEFYRVARLREYLFPEDLIHELEVCMDRNRGTVQEDLTPVILSGILPNPHEILTILDDLKVRVVQDDFLIGSRRLSAGSSDQEDPLAQLAGNHFSTPPCSTKGSSIAQRKEYILRLIRGTGARGVIFNMVKFCEPEWFDIPNLQDELRNEGIPTLVMDTELNQALSGQIKTRVEAFVEMIS
jgi:benzoyl-CoA reductase/2-hydroxyglutaryl-CoA dehydratase subunit BcrC/BadD/HgdB